MNVLNKRLQCLTDWVELASLKIAVLLQLCARPVLRVPMLCIAAKCVKRRTGANIKKNVKHKVH
eukprot:14287-Heterococcus_DN1.PRE.1